MPRQLPDILKAYADYTSDSESPQIFHIWVALGTIAGAAQRKISMPASHFTVYTNMYIILVSPPGIGKKSTALRVGKNFLKGIQPKANFLTGSISAGKLIQRMSQISNPAHQSMTAYASELGTFLGIDPVNMVDFMTDIYDCEPDWDKQTLARDLEKLEHPWLNFMTGTTPQWLGENASATFVEGGFAARSIYPFSDENIVKEPFPEETPLQRELRPKIWNDLSVIATLDGTFKFSPSAKDFYYNWYLDKKRFPAMMDHRLAGYYTRKHIHVLKVAMALSLSYKDELILDKEDIQRAITLLDGSEPGMRHAFSAVGKNEYATDLERVRAQIISRGRVTYSELLAANYHNLGKRGLDNILEELRYMGVKIENTNGNRSFAMGGDG